jgi:hypothetical protein
MSHSDDERCFPSDMRLLCHQISSCYRHWSLTTPPPQLFSFYFPLKPPKGHHKVTTQNIHLGSRHWGIDDLTLGRNKVCLKLMQNTLRYEARSPQGGNQRNKLHVKVIGNRGLMICWKLNIGLQRQHQIFKITYFSSETGASLWLT